MMHSFDLAYIRQLCCLGLGWQAIMPALLHALHRVIPSYANVFQYTDENGQITNLYAESPVAPEFIQLYLSAFKNRRGLTVSLSCSETPNLGGTADGSRSAWTQKHYRPDVHKLIRQPCGIRHIVGRMVREGGCALGAVLLYRASRDPPFTRSEEALLTTLASYIAHALRTTPNFSGAYMDSGEQGFIILNQHGKTLFICPQGRRLLFLSTHAQIAPHTVCRSDNYEIPLALLRRLNNLRAIFNDQTAAPPVVDHENPWGKFIFCAYWLEQNDYSDDALIGVSVQRQEPLPLKLMRIMQGLPLSAAQREVCLLLADGHTHGAIARRLNICLSTATDHVRKIYDKLDVHSHEQLMQKLKDEPGGPVRHA